LFTEDKVRKGPRYITVFSILLTVIGLGYFFEAVYNLFYYDYVSEIILFANATANILFALGNLRRYKWAWGGTIVLSILNIIYTLLSLGLESIIDSVLKFVIYGLTLFYFCHPGTKEYFRNLNISSTPSLHVVTVLSTHKSQLGSIVEPKGIKYLRKIFLLFSIFYFIIFIILVNYFSILVSEDSEINPDTRRTKNLAFNKTDEYYFYLSDYFIILGYGLTWLIIYFSMRTNKSWSRAIILIVSIIYIAFGKYNLLPYSTETTGIAAIYIAIQTGIAIVLLFYFNKPKVREFYQNIKDARIV